LLDFGTQNDGLSNLRQGSPLLLMLAFYSQVSFVLAHSRFSLPIARAFSFSSRAIPTDRLRLRQVSSQAISSNLLTVSQRTK